MAVHQWELNIQQMSKALQDAKKKANAYQAAAERIFQYFIEAGINASVVMVDVEGFDNLADAICGWLDYDEFGFENILKKLEELRNNEKTNIRNII